MVFFALAVVAGLAAYEFYWLMCGRRLPAGDPARDRVRPGAAPAGPLPPSSL